MPACPKCHEEYHTTPSGFLVCLPCGSKLQPCSEVTKNPIAPRMRSVSRKKSLPGQQQLFDMEMEEQETVAPEDVDNKKLKKRL